MTKNPLANALGAYVYITLVGLFMTWGTGIAPKKDTFLAPIAVISLFTLSAAVMGYIFCFQPLQLFLDGHKKQAVSLFLRTVLVFGLLTAMTLLLVFTGVFR